MPTPIFPSSSMPVQNTRSYSHSARSFKLCGKRMAVAPELTTSCLDGRQAVTKLTVCRRSADLAVRSDCPGRLTRYPERAALRDIIEKPNGRAIQVYGRRRPTRPSHFLAMRLGPEWIAPGFSICAEGLSGSFRGRFYGGTLILKLRVPDRSPEAPRWSSPITRAKSEWLQTTSLFYYSCKCFFA